MTARDDYPRLAAIDQDRSHSTPVLQEQVRAALEEIDWLRALTDPEISVNELEMQMRSGRIDLKMLSDPNENHTAHVAGKFLAAMMLRFLHGEDGTLPPNYRSADIMVKPAGGFDEYKCAIEVRMPRGKSSHDIRLEHEERMSRAQAILRELDPDEVNDEITWRHIQAALDALAHNPAPPQPEETS